MTNCSQRKWSSSGSFPVALSYHWRQRAESGFQIFDGVRFPLPRDLLPGEGVTLACAVPTPHSPCRYQLEFDLVREGISWFSDCGSPKATVDCEVVGLHAEDGVEGFDYQSEYANVDLDRDYWSIVGPATREEFEALGRGKREMLISYGLHPGSRILDVGCGTGQLTEPLHQYLSDQGLYYGTDIAAEAVAFCRKRFKRPNFVFLQNGMTDLPIRDIRFDFIYLGSVFTHMFPDEIRAMLDNLKVHLDDQGLLIADAFVTAKPEEFVGTRSLVEINERHLLGILKNSGLQFTVLADMSWSSGARRCTFEMGHPGRAMHGKAA